MPAPAIMAAAPIIQGIGNELKKPVIGWTRTTTKVKKNATVTTERKIELRAWELGLGVLGVGAAMIAAYGMRIWTWKEHYIDVPHTVYTPVIRPGSGTFGSPPIIDFEKRIITTKQTVHLPAANTNVATDVFGQKTQEMLIGAGIFGPLYPIYQIMNGNTSIPYSHWV